LELLYKYGGIYVDIDMALVKPIDEFLQKYHTDFFIGVSFTKPFEVNNAILGSSPANPILKFLIERLNIGY
jgi:mannosyltransferase OCH1-like enzyme